MKSTEVRKDALGRVLWGHVPGFVDFFKKEAPQRTTDELAQLIEDRYQYRASRTQIENIRRRFGIHMSAETKRRALDGRDLQVVGGQTQLPNFVRELGPKDEGFFSHVSGDCFVTSDWHCPYHNESLVERLLALAKRLKVTQLVINGDFLNQDAFSKFRHHRFNIPWPVEKSAARELITRLFNGFETIYLILDNHDRRLLAANEVRQGGLDESDVIELLTYGVKSEKLRVSVDYRWVLVNQTWRVTSPREYRRVKLSLPNRLAQLYHQHIISGGDHLFGVGLDDSGHYVIANDMCMVHRDEVPYVMTQDSCYPHWNNGFYAIIENVLYPFCDHPNLWPKWPEWLQSQREF